MRKRQTGTNRRVHGAPGLASNTAASGYAETGNCKIRATTADGLAGVIASADAAGVLMGYLLFLNVLAQDVDGRPAAAGEVTCDSPRQRPGRMARWSSLCAGTMASAEP